jgi:hypothetical protein
MSSRITAALLVISLLTVSAQDETLIDIARRSAPNPVFQSRSAELVMISVESVIPDADRIVQGTVESSKTYLSADKKNLYTDYVVRPLRVMKPVQSTPATSRPGTNQILSIVVTRWGGEMLLEGVRVIQEDHDTPQFKVGEELILLLSQRGADKFGLAAPVSSAFTVSRGQVQPLTLGGHPVYDTVRGLSVAQFEALVRRSSR